MQVKCGFISIADGTLKPWNKDECLNAPIFFSIYNNRHNPINSLEAFCEKHLKRYKPFLDTVGITTQITEAEYKLRRILK